MKGPMAQILAQAQKMQENVKRAQDEIARMEITGESGAGSKPPRSRRCRP